MKIFFDASVLIAGLLSPTGGSYLLLSYLKSKKIVGVISMTVIEELIQEEVLIKMKLSKADIERFIVESGLLVREAITTEEIAPYKNKIDIDDAHLVVGARITRCSFLVTLDKKHLLNDAIRERFLPLRIVSPKEMLENITNITTS